MEQLDNTDASVDAMLGGRHEIAFTDESHCDRVTDAIVADRKQDKVTSRSRRLGDYELLQPLGQGGMGMVYRARHVEMGTPTAVKILQPHRQADQATIDRFEREMVAIGRLDHPNIVRALDAGQEGDQHYLVMEYVDGFDLSRVANAHGALAIADAAEVIRQAAMGLSYVHQHGRVHRDVKPSNLILARDGTVKLMDLGLARVGDFPVEETVDNADDILAGSTVDLTRSHQVMGTPEYMPPEQVADSSKVDHRADVYSLGCTFYKLLTGQSPLASSGPITALNQLVDRVQAATIPVCQKREDVPRALGDLLDRMLAKRREDRPQTAEEIAGLLRPFAAGANLRRLAASTNNRLTLLPSVAPARDDFSTVGDGDTEMLVTTPSAAGHNQSAPLAAVFAAALLTLAAIVTVSLLWLLWNSPSGTVVVQAESPEVAERLATGNANLIADDTQVPIRVGKIDIPAGRYVVSADAGSQLKFSQSTIDLKRNQQLVLSVGRSLTDLVGDASTQPSSDPDSFEPANQTIATGEPSEYEPVNLISLVKPKRDIRGHDWRLVDAALISDPDKPSMMMFPYQPPDEYRVELVATRLEKNESLQLGLVADNRPVILAIDTYPAEGFLSGLYQLDGRPARSHRGQLLPIGRPVPIVATLRRDGQRLSIEMTVDDRLVLSWRGSISQATGVGSFPLPQSGFMFLANWTASIKVSDLRVIPLSGDGTIVAFTDPETDRQRAAIERVVWNGGAVSIVGKAVMGDRSLPTVVGGFELVRQFEGHTGSVKAVAISPDGKLAASGSGWPNGDQTLRIWDIETGTQLHVLKHGANVMHVAFSQDGQQVLAGGSSPEMTLWDVKSGELLRKYTAGNATYFEQVAFTRDGTRIIATTGRDQVVYELDTETGDVIHRWDTGSSALCFAISPDNSRLAIGLNNTAVILIDLETGQTLRQLDGPELDLSGRFAKETYALDISDDGTRLAAGYKGNAIRLWDLQSGEVLKDIRSPVFGTEEIKFMPDGQQLIVVGFNGVAGLIDLETEQVLGSTPLIPGHGWGVALLPDGETILTCGGMKSGDGFQRTGDYALRMWKLGEPGENEQEPAEQRPTIQIDRWADIPSDPQIIAIDVQRSSWFDDDDMAALADLPELDSLDLSGTTITAAGIEQLGPLPNVTSLSLAGTMVREISESLATQFPSLKKLELQNTSITNASVTALNGFDKLVRLDLGGTRLMVDGLSDLNPSPKLQSLGLAGTSVSRLDHLTADRFPKLSRLNLLGTRVSPDEISAVRERMPNTEIVSGLEPVDVIALVDVNRDADTEYSKGKTWRKEDGRLFTTERTRISVPIVLPSEFDFRMTAKSHLAWQRADHRIRAPGRTPFRRRIRSRSQTRLLHDPSRRRRCAAAE